MGLTEERFTKSGLNTRSDSNGSPPTSCCWTGDSRKQDRGCQEADSRVTLRDVSGGFTHPNYDLIITDAPVPTLTTANAARYIDQLTVIEVKPTAELPATRHSTASSRLVRKAGSAISSETLGDRDR